ncbi:MULTISPECIES: cysteine synthase A [Actinotignum]|uniref:Cysteine synthase n=1 Tax=Actinotignum timonense TaxID=1870995 RepID=A0AAW9HHV5_9ACTO|nr:MULTISPECIES: cysteine synthase A [Actinotignum]MBS5749054.1 cysteine synthase A [Actinotignum schaalii]MDE1557891.1 cysteine synthase A [Actinotignum schaalii]MDE1662714.1 cysteine synthase A [Actinotignum schaalii]MDK6373261.1 cysteine synthase A [Actinotignum timonense]MDK6418857.1 cysteine synthase A [Actinotignum timonense]
MTIFNDATELVGHTPLVRINKLAEGSSAEVLAKLEFYNPANSVKDRVAVAIVDAAEKAGALRPGGTIVEGTSGNTGIGLAWVGAARGYKVILTMPASMSVERRMLLRTFGARLELTDPKEGMRGAVARAEEIVATTENAILASQFTNVANPAIHEKTTGEEIWADTEGKVDYFVAGIGTGGTITGAGRALRRHNPDVKIIAVEPAESPLLSEGRAGSHGIQGIGANFVPEVLDTELYNEVIPVPTAKALEVARAAATSEGLLLGISGGAALQAALEVAGREEAAGKRIVVIIPDFGERYASTPLFDPYRD